ncbi:methylated-DNA-[protein]-cysteine S-methyltransferase [Spinactinospora alkalitolerans]|uniref:Methylated-DNA-[protein]-cysteine S-methyltransferase n=1 Tax=Spinactinospora alkalitolerans TaxID=687207 RepID=A0A852U0P0_9ACTN|nr:methylated-DNA--[protein]-cysteine S-methyltransferase [Spinactinospora alkalitolerans]NYE48902.1 methylated-DNA-[protein]-cysteine S-methyltransferase [Spinactinospora alkalitolerans]
MIKALVMETPIGALSLLERQGCCVGAGFHADPARLHRDLHPSLREPLTEVTDLGAIGAAVRRYFEGEIDAFDDIPVHQPSTPTRERLWAVMREVRAGGTVSYGGLATAAGLPASAARVAGGACAGNLVAPIVPCHRVVAAGGSLHHYGYGLPRKEWLLRHEGSIL